MRYYQVSQDADIPRLVATLARYAYPSRAFFFAQTSQCCASMGHAQTATVAECRPDGGVSAQHDEFIRFLTAILMRASDLSERRAGKPPPDRRALRQQLLVLCTHYTCIRRMASIGPVQDNG